MKCPKCGYLGFEHVERCRNCGYQFSLTPAAAPELPLRETTVHPGDDLALVDAAMDSRFRGNAATENLDRVVGAPQPPVATAVATMTEDKYWWFDPPDNELPIAKASPPRPPLAVRRTPEAVRLRVERPRAQLLDLAPDPANFAPAAATVSRPARAQGWLDAREASAVEAPAEEARAEDAGLGARVLAATLDLSILGAIDALVVYFTMQICSLGLAELSLLPKAPLGLFLLTQNCGYLVAFTAGGQTLGKMATGIRVVPMESPSSLDVGRASVRTLVWVLLAIPAGLGFAPAFYRRDHRGIHDRCAGTRVVRAST